MLRRWLDSFIKKNKNVIIKFAKMIGILFVVIIIVTSIMSQVIRVNQSSSSKTQNSISIYNPTDTVIEGKKITKDEYSKDGEIIANFIKFCNESDVDSAYKLLSDDCKELLFPNINDFKNDYLSKLFTSKCEYNVKSWINESDYHTYKVTFLEDLISTGKYSDSQKGQDYITVVSSNGEEKINLCGYIKREQIKKQSGSEEIKALAVEKRIYVDYEEYTVKIKNMTDSPILLDTQKNRNSIKLMDENNVYYYAFKDRISNLKSSLSSGVIRTLDIRFNKTYSSNTQDSYIEFSDIVKDIEQYNQKSDYAERENLKIEL